jgi:hypothetical protein
MRRFTMLSLIASVAGCTEAAPTTPQLQSVAALANAMVANEKQPVDLVFTACNGETVAMSGTVHTRFRLTTSKSGNVSASLSSDYNLSGIGDATGAQYNGKLSIRDQEMATDNVSGFRHRTSLRLVGQGNVPNSVAGFTVHVVIANGETRVEHTDVTSSCDP